MMLRQLLFVLTACRPAMACFERDQDTIENGGLVSDFSGESKQMLEL
jgi:hypothetical protein